VNYMEEAAITPGGPFLSPMAPADRAGDLPPRGWIAMMDRHRLSELGRVLALCLALAGCGGAEDDLPREAVSGQVTLDGVPLKRATIHFDPEGPVPAHPVAVGGVVIDGSYSIPRAKGPTPGTYRVSIFPSEAIGTGAVEEEPPRKRAKRAQAPTAYISKSPLKAEVKLGGSNTFEFALSSR
jgi:hypothetical protein